MATEVKTKKQMYRMLDAGCFGNTIQRWYNLDDWERRPPEEDVPLWAIRNAVTCGGDPRTRLDVPTAELPALYESWYGKAGGEISPMVDYMLTARFQLIEYPDLEVHYVIGLREIKWREAFALHGKVVRGIMARTVLRQYLNPSSMEDLWQLLDEYPGHAIELTALDRCYGTIPGRNGVVWELRGY